MKAPARAIRIGFRHLAQRDRKHHVAAIWQCDAWYGFAGVKTEVVGI